MDLRPIFGVFARETGYERGGRLRMMWWRKAAAEKQLKVTVEAILAAERVQQQKEYGMHGGSQGGSKGRSTDSKG